ncbi:[FeFe] hydrogenase H-cluster radical SAM maturase HydG [Carboxydothermus islandicus]|uniref:[FeFe] hydrogenase H-cluster radical SAM maturase HydG n=1 Tax=Carboxydothermus islandicus TaxID=661089 RepID=A0A1L8D1R1_9THEO|nr:[FeFe] hydrogenase H-cluster radical SAM maturase HydG [Carboxydothermus islandicus]GAV25089.1 [FeFe] hydrogenase H-cluster radical SAM maturase HydG [Carboxydothermus islandicus]
MMTQEIATIVQRTYEIVKKINRNPKEELFQIIQKLQKGERLSLLEAGIAFATDTEELDQILFWQARKVKEEIYGKRIVLFAPLYLSNICINNCSYCSFRRENKDLSRVRLSLEEAVEEAKAIREMGHTRILLVMGEEPEDKTLSYLEEIIPAIYSEVDIRRINVNIAPLTLKGYERLKKLNIGTYQLFQESYNREIYRKVHLDGPKTNFHWRLTAVERAIEAGIDDIGIGALFGLGDPLFELLGVIAHADYLKKKFGIGPHTVSVPRLKPASNSVLSNDFKISDHKFKKIVAILRIMLPYTGIILSTREPQHLRDELVELGVSQMSAASRTGPGEYRGKRGDEERQQFLLSDHRSLAEIVEVLIEKGFLPSFCTACYRKRRTGKTFMGLADRGQIKDFCTPNALFSFAEYLYEIKDKHPELYKKGIGYLLQVVKRLSNSENIGRAIEYILKGEKDVFL